MSASIRIDFVSDVSCPWCAIGLAALEIALQRVDGEISAELHFQPFELNPGMPPAGQDITEHLTQKYGSTPEQQAQSREVIRQRGAELGFVFRKEGRDRIYNTFDAHRLLHWAAGTPHQLPLKKALFAANFTDDADVSDHAVLARIAASVGLDEQQALQVLRSGAWADEVRAAEKGWISRGIQAVPGMVINGKWLISGGQTPEVLEQALREIAAQVSQKAEGPAS